MGNGAGLHTLQEYTGVNMAKPIFWLVFSPGTDYRKFSSRAGARIYAATLKAMGHSVTIKAMGF